MKIEVSDLMNLWGAITFAYDVKPLDHDGIHTSVIDKGTELGVVQLECRNAKDTKMLRDTLAAYGIEEIKGDSMYVDQFGAHSETSALEEYGISKRMSSLVFDKNRLTFDFKALPKEAQELFEFLVVARAQSNMEYLHEVNKAKSLAAGIKRVKAASDNAHSGIGSKGVNDLKKIIEQVAQAEK